MFRSLLPATRRGSLASFDEPFSSLQREINQLIDDAFRGYPVLSKNGKMVVTPSMDVKETDKTIEVEAELPGVDEKDVQVTFDDGVLTIQGEKKTEKEETKAGYHVSERSYGSFFRSLELPAGIDADKISANCAKGVLKVTLPKLAGAQTKAKKIEIKPGK